MARQDGQLWPHLPHRGLTEGDARPNAAVSSWGTPPTNATTPNLTPNKKPQPSNLFLEPHEDSLSPLSTLLLGASHPFRRCDVDRHLWCKTHGQKWKLCVGGTIRQREAGNSAAQQHQLSGHPASFGQGGHSSPALSSAPSLRSSCISIGHLPYTLATGLTQRERKRSINPLTSSASLMHAFIGFPTPGEEGESAVRRPTYRARRAERRERIYSGLHKFAIFPAPAGAAALDDNELMELTCAVCNVNGHGITTSSGANIWLDYAATYSIDVLALIDDRTKADGRYNDLAVKRLVRGWHVSQWTVAAGGQHLSTNVGGVTILVGPSYSRFVRHRYEDATGLGVVGALLLATPGRKTLIVATYWMTKSGKEDNNSLWSRLSRRLKDMGRRGETPIEYIQSQCARFTQKALANSWEIILLGDFNAEYGKSGKTHGDVKRWADEVGLTNLPYLHMLPRQEPIITRRSHKGTPSALDHILSKSSGSRLRCSAVHTNCDLPAAHISDHTPLAATFQIIGSLGGSSYHPTVFPTLDLDIRNPKHTAAFQTAMAEAEYCLPPCLESRSSYTLDRHGARRLATQCTHFLDAVCVRAVSVAQSLNKTHTLNQKPYQCWSPLFLLATYHLGFLQAVRSIVRNQGVRKVTVERKLQAIDASLELLRSRICSLDKGKRELSLTLLAEGTRAFEDWTNPGNLDLLLGWADTDVPIVRRRMHGRARAENRACISRFVRINEDRRKGKEYKKLLSSIFEKYRKPLNELVLEGGELLVDPVLIHDKLNSHMADWHSRNLRTEDHIDWIRSISDRSYIIEHPAYFSLPVHLREAIADSLAAHSDNDVLRREMSHALAKEITFTDFQDTIRGKASGKSAGISQFSINMLKSIPTDLLHYVYLALNYLWVHRETGVSPESWKHRFLAMVPKLSDSAPVLDQIRPISLYEVLRKTWTAIVTSRIVGVWEMLKIIDKSQCGYMRGKGTHTELLQIINAVEEAAEQGEELLLTSYDTSKAFDSVDKCFMTAAWIRLGVPPDVADYLNELDAGGKTIIKTPHSVSCLRRFGMGSAVTNTGNISSTETCSAFRAINGIGQGDTPSAMGWVAVFDILLVALRKSEGTRFHTRTYVGQLAAVDANAYADDLNILSPCQSHAQGCLDLYSAFNYVAGLTANISKMKCVSSHKSNSILQFHDHNWVPHPITVNYREPIKVLGVKVDLCNNWVEQKLEIINKISRMLDQISRKRVSNQSRHLAFTMTFLATAIYPLKFLPLTLEEYEEIRRPVNSFLKRIFGCKLQIPAELLYIDQRHGGLQLPDLVERIQRQKRTCLASITRGASLEQHIGAALLHRVLRQEAIPTAEHENHLSSISESTKSWIGSSLESLMKLPNVALTYNNPHHNAADVGQTSIQRYVGDENLITCTQELARCDLETLGELCKLDGHGERQLCTAPGSTVGFPIFTQTISRLLDPTSIPQSIPDYPKTLRQGGLYTSQHHGIVEFTGQLNGPPNELIFRGWVSVDPQLSIGSIITPDPSTERRVVVGIEAASITGQIYARRTTKQPTGSRYRVEDTSEEVFKVPPSPVLYIRTPATTPIPNLFIFTDGSLSRHPGTEEIMFDPTLSGRMHAGAGAVAFVGDRIVKVIEVQGIDQADIAGLNPAIPEVIAMIAFFIEYGEDCRGATVFSDCKSMLELIKGPSQGHIFPSCPYISTVKRLAYYKGVNFEWVESHPERQQGMTPGQWNLRQRGNHAAHLAAAGEINEIKCGDGHPYQRCTIRFARIVEELKKSSLFYLTHNGVPTGVRQLAGLRAGCLLRGYLDKRTKTSASHRGLIWTDLTVALSAKILKKCRPCPSKVTIMKIIYDKYDDDRYKKDEKRKFCPLCCIDGEEDLTDHLFRCSSIEAQRVVNLTKQKFELTPLSAIASQHPNATQFREVLRELLYNQHTCRIGRLDSEHRQLILNSTGNLSKSMAKIFHLDLVNLTQIFANATLELVTMRNATRAPIRAPIIRNAIQTYGTVWSAAGHPGVATVQANPARLSPWETTPLTSQLNVTRSGKSSQLKARKTVGERLAIRLSPWDSRKSRPTQSKTSLNSRGTQNPRKAPTMLVNNNRFEALSEDDDGERGDEVSGAYRRDTSQGPTSATIEEYNIPPHVSLTIEVPGHPTTVVRLQKEGNLDRQITKIGSNSIKYLIVDEEQQYTCLITPSNRPARQGGTRSDQIQDNSKVLIRQSHPPTPFAPKRLIDSHRLVAGLRDHFYGWREVRGDGGCYYRAIYLSIMERVIGKQPSREANLRWLHSKFESIENTLLETYGDMVSYRQLMDDLKNQREMFDSVPLFESYIIVHPAVDTALICIMKSVIGHTLCDQDSAFMREHLEVIMGYYRHAEDIEDSQWVDAVWQGISPLNEYAEGPFVQLHLIPTFFESGCQLVHYDDINAPYNIISNISGVDSEYVTRFCIILHQEHYDILYARASGAYVSPGRQHQGELQPVIYNQTRINSQSAKMSSSLDHPEDITHDFHEAPD